MSFFRHLWVGFLEESGCVIFLLSRAVAFLLLKDSKASYTIEGETPPHNRIERWGRVIGEAGKRKISVLELEYLQQIVIEDNRFITPGLRKEGGFVFIHPFETGCYESK